MGDDESYEADKAADRYSRRRDEGGEYIGHLFQSFHIDPQLNRRFFPHYDKV